MAVAKRQGKGQTLENRTKEGPRTIIDVRGVCNFLGSVLSQQNFEVTDGPVLQLRFIQKEKEKTYSRHEGMLAQKTRREGRPPAHFWLFFLYFFSPLPGPALCKRGQPAVLFVLLGVLTLVLGSSLFYFHGLFPSLSFSYRHSGLFPVLTT